MSYVAVPNCSRLNVLAFLSQSRAPEIRKGNLSRVKDAASPRGLKRIGVSTPSRARLAAPPGSLPCVCKNR